MRVHEDDHYNRMLRATVGVARYRIIFTAAEQRSRLHMSVKFRTPPQTNKYVLFVVSSHALEHFALVRIAPLRKGCKMYVFVRRLRPLSWEEFLSGHNHCNKLS